MAEASDFERVRVIEPSRGWVAIDWAEIWRYRELLYFLSWRDVKIRYRQTVLGVGWAVLQPILCMAVFSLFFGRLAGLSAATGSTPYPLYVFAGLVPWFFFANAISSSSRSLIGSSSLITKIYFPRMVIPLAAAATGLVDLLVSLVALLALFAYYDVNVSPQILLAPVLIFALYMLSAGVGTLLAALTVTYRDVHHVVPFAIQLAMFVTPVVYPASIVPARWRFLLVLNPLAGIMEGFRAALLGRQVDWISLAFAFRGAMCIFLLGAVYFRQVERARTDVI
jgi:lipopolysaccharide transport system permease protein